MSEETVNIHDAKTRLSQLVARAEKGGRITIARGGKPVAELGPSRKRKRQALPAADPLLNLDTFSVDVPRGTQKNADIDRALYGGAVGLARYASTLRAVR